ncbi:hypothetical protein BH09SUM1_BH09SUM1_32000 [soil metagenome]
MLPEQFQRIRVIAIKNRLTAVLGVLLLCCAGYFFFKELRPDRLALHMTAGDVLSARHPLALKIAAEAEGLGLDIDVIPTEGSGDALKRVDSHEFDFALVQGGMPFGENVRQVAALYPEPLHLLVRPEIADGGFAALRGKRINLGPPDTGTNRLAAQTLAFAGLLPGRDFTAEELGYEELMLELPADLPDAIFMVQSVPSDMAGFFVKRRGYGLLELPFGDSMAVRDFSVTSAQIPLMAYSVDPPVPDRPIATVANYLLLVANKDVPKKAVSNLLEAIFHRELARTANLPALNADSMQRIPEIAMHPGAEAFRDRNDPLLTTDFIDRMENLRSLIVSSAIALFILWRWYSRRNSIGFEKYLAEVTSIEKRVMDLEKEARLNLEELLKLRTQLSGLKSEALEKFAAGKLKGEELMASFLTHVTDVRNYLGSLILYERERLGDVALHGKESGANPDANLAELWREAVGGEEE